MKSRNLLVLLISFLTLFSISAPALAESDTLNYTITCSGPGPTDDEVIELKAIPSPKADEQKLLTVIRPSRGGPAIGGTEYTIGSVEETHSSIYIAGFGRVFFPGSGSLNYRLEVDKHSNSAAMIEIIRAWSPGEGANRTSVRGHVFGDCRIAPIQGDSHAP